MKKKLLRGLTVLVLVSVVLGVMGCGESIRQLEKGSVFYTKNNTHYYVKVGKAQKLAAIQHFTKISNHSILPYNSAVSVKTYGRGFVLVDQKTGDPIYVECKKKYLGGYSLGEYLDLILSDSPVSYPDLSDVDKKGIALGQPMKDMSKQGVMIALGYPLPSRTASEKSDVWYYWKNRFDYYPVQFDGGVVESHGY